MSNHTTANSGYVIELMPFLTEVLRLKPDEAREVDTKNEDIDQLVDRLNELCVDKLGESAMNVVEQVFELSPSDESDDLEIHKQYVLVSDDAVWQRAPLTELGEKMCGTDTDSITKRSWVKFG